MHPLFHPLFIDYCTYFNGNHDYFECHEVLEEYWKDIAPGEKEHPLVGYIQVATGLYHWRRGNMRGARRMLSNGVRILHAATGTVFAEKIDFTKFLDCVKNALVAVNEDQDFAAFAIVITDEELAQAVTISFSALPEEDPHFIQHKHTLRDRSEVIEERSQQLRKRDTDGDLFSHRT